MSKVIPFSTPRVRECFDCNEVIDPWDPKSFTTRVVVCGDSGSGPRGYDAPLCRECWAQEKAEDVVREMDALKQTHFARLRELSDLIERDEGTEVGLAASNDLGGLLRDLHRQACEAAGVDASTFSESACIDVAYRIVQMP